MALNDKCAVLLPVYKNDKPSWFQEAISSVVNQVGLGGVPRIYLGIDGPIGKDLRQVIETNSQSFWKVVEHQVNSGLPVMLNNLIRSLGPEDYVFRIDADDICEPTRFAEQIAFLQVNGEIGIVSSALREIDLEGSELGIRSWHLDSESVWRNLYKGTALAHPAVCFKRPALELLGFYREDIGMCEDLELWFRAAKLGVRMANLPSPLVRFRVTQETFKRRGREKVSSEFKVYWCGCLELYGLTWRNLFPVMRFLCRILPPSLISLIYKSNLREFFLGRVAR